MFTFFMLCFIVIIAASIQATPTPGGWGGGDSGAGTALRVYADQFTSTNHCEKGWSDVETQGYQCESSDWCRKAKTHLNVLGANCWGGCDDGQLWCKKSSLEARAYSTAGSGNYDIIECCIQ